MELCLREGCVWITRGPVPRGAIEGFGGRSPRERSAGAEGFTGICASMVHMAGGMRARMRSRSRGVSSTLEVV